MSMVRVGIGALVLLAACGGGAAKSSTSTTTTTTAATHTLTGKVVLHGHSASVLSANGVGTDCGTAIGMGFPLPSSRPSSYDSWKTGAPVLVKDQNNTVIGSGALSTGVAGNEVVGIAAGANLDCTFTFSIPGIVGAPTFYSVTIGTGNPLTFSQAQVTAANGHLAIDATP